MYDSTKHAKCAKGQNMPLGSKSQMRINGRESKIKALTK
jgi:hypothetical protein